MNIPPLYIASAITAIILMVVLIKLSSTKESQDFIEIGEDNEESIASPPEVITIYLVSERAIPGKKLLKFFMDHHLQFSEKQEIFISLANKEEQFFVATLSSPGTFDINTMIDNEYHGLSFFMQTTASKMPLDNFDAMCLVLFDAKEIFEARLQSDDKSEITLDQLREIREQISHHQNS